MHADNGGGFEDGASLNVSGLNLFDYFNLNNALNNGNSVPATASYSVHWAGDGSPMTINDGHNFHFQGRRTNATVSWSAQEKGFRFDSDSAHDTITNFALVGHETNGVFYK